MRTSGQKIWHQVFTNCHYHYFLPNTYKKLQNLTSIVEKKLLYNKRAAKRKHPENKKPAGNNLKKLYAPLRKFSRNVVQRFRQYSPSTQPSKLNRQTTTFTCYIVLRNSCPLLKITPTRTAIHRTAVWWWSDCGRNRHPFLYAS